MQKYIAVINVPLINTGTPLLVIIANMQTASFTTQRSKVGRSRVGRSKVGLYVRTNITVHAADVSAHKAAPVVLDVDRFTATHFIVTVTHFTLAHFTVSHSKLLSYQVEGRKISAHKPRV